jgi:DNA-binding phage protein
MRPRDFNHLPTWLRAAIARANIEGIEALARRSNISRTALYRYLNDDDRPSEETMARICRALGVDLAEGLRQYTPKRNGRPPLRDDIGKRRR